MSKNKAIQHLNNNGLSSRTSSVRQRRLFQAGVRMLSESNYSISATEVQKKKLYDILCRIEKNKVDKEMEFIPSIDKVFLNKLTQIEERIWLSEFISTARLKKERLPTGETAIVPNNVKRDAINKAKASLKLNKTQKKHLARYNSDLGEFLKAVEKVDWFHFLGDIFDDHKLFQLKMDQVRWREKDPIVSPYSREDMIAAAEKVQSKIGPLIWNQPDGYESKWVRGILKAKKTYQQGYDDLGFKPVEIDPEIAAQPDTFVAPVYETCDVVDYFVQSSRTDFITYQLPSSTNHVALEKKQDIFDKMCTEIYQLSQLPGFVCMENHWRGFKYNQLKTERKISEWRSRVHEGNYQKPKKTKKHKKFKKTKTWQNNLKGSRELSAAEKEEFMAICEEHRVKILEGHNMVKEDIMREIKKDLHELIKSHGNYGNYIKFDINFRRKCRMMPPEVEKRYNIFFRSIMHNKNVYNYLDYHFRKYKEHLKKCKPRSDSDYEDY
jgi:hypothetical protein